MVNFRLLSIATAIISIILFFILLCVPQLIFQLFELEGNEPAYFISRRAAMLFLGFAVLIFMARNAQHSEARQAIALGIGTAMMGLAILGSYELIRGYTGAGILGAIVTEIIIALSYFNIWFTHRSLES